MAWSEVSSEQRDSELHWRGAEDIVQVKVTLGLAVCLQKLSPSLLPPILSQLTFLLEEEAESPEQRPAFSFICLAKEEK